VDEMFEKKELHVKNQKFYYYSLESLKEKGYEIDRLPFSIKVLLESAIRNFDGMAITKEQIEQLANWSKYKNNRKEIGFKPGRILLQDFTGVPAVVDLAAMRSAFEKKGKDATKINPLIPVDLVIDHSVMVDTFGNEEALGKNTELEFSRNEERYEFLRWAQEAFTNFRVVPPGTGIVHQVNLEYLASVVMTKEENGETIVFPDSLVGTDSHTTMINGLGVLGWGVGGIEAEAGMLGQPLYFVSPEVIGCKLTGKLPEGTTATDLALTITNILRKKGVVGKFVEFFGPALTYMNLADRATVANMAPEYGATMGFFPVDDETIEYLRLTGRDESLIDLVKEYYTKQGLYRTNDMPSPIFTDVVEVDLNEIKPSLAGPKRPQDKVLLSEMKKVYNEAVRKNISEGGFGLSEEEIQKEVSITHANGEKSTLKNGNVVIAAITSCTNTSNPSVMIAAGLLAKKAVEKGLTVPSYVKTSIAPGSKVVTSYLQNSGLISYLEKLGFFTAGYGCTTCIGNSGPLYQEIEDAISEKNLTVASVLSGNRNFEGRVHPKVKANYLASPPLVVAYAIAGTVDIDLTKEAIGYTPTGDAVYLSELFPSQDEINGVIKACLKPDIFREKYEDVFNGNTQWNKIKTSKNSGYVWDRESTYIQEPPFFIDFKNKKNKIGDIKNAKVLAFLGDSVTTDHISPAGAIGIQTPAGKYLKEKNVSPRDFNSYGSRRGNDQIMTRGTFANIRIRNKIADGKEGGYTKHIPTDTLMSIYDASIKYQEENTDLIIIAGKEYGTGSSRDWAAKGTYLLGVKAVIAESFERIHRSNLVGMGVLPICFVNGENAESLGLTGFESFSILDLEELSVNKKITIKAVGDSGKEICFQATIRLDSNVEIQYFKDGGILQNVLKNV
jgi:aconitate hydratase